MISISQTSISLQIGGVCLRQHAPTHGLCHVGYQAIVAAPKMMACKTSEWIMSILGSRGPSQAALPRKMPYY